MERSIGQTTNKKPSGGVEKTNYRPVSNLGFISKIVQKVTHNLQNMVMKTDYYPHTSQHIEETTVVKLA